MLYQYIVVEQNNIFEYILGHISAITRQVDDNGANVFLLTDALFIFKDFKSLNYIINL